MIRDAGVAREISDLMIEMSMRIDASIATVQEKCPPEEFKAYRLAAAKVLGEILLEIMNPLYAQHPALKPLGLD